MNEPLWIKRIRTAKEKVEDYVAFLNYCIAKDGNNEDKSKKLEESRKKLAELEHKYKESIIKYKEWQIRNEFK
jgi:hypothetical protein